MNRIDKLFQQKKNNILSVFFTAGYPVLQDTISIAAYLEQAGTDMIELGIPFSDPIADGPVIQQSNARAIANGMNVSLLLEQVREIRKKVNLPLVLMGYLNPVMQYGVEKFFRHAADAGADGVILPDLPAEEYAAKYRKLACETGIHTVFLITPTTTDERIRMLDELSGGFLYAVSLSGVTGARRGFSTAQQQFLERLMQLNLKNPVLAGFGISDYAGFSAVCRYVNGAIVGSAFVEALQHSADVKGAVQEFIKRLLIE